MIGIGFDVHKLVEKRPLVLAGVTIPSEKGALAHSDGDVILHALCDALLGAMGVGDIGDHFPDTDPQWKGASSSVFVQHVTLLMQERRLFIVNIDCTLVLQEPKIAAYKHEMKSAIAALCSIPESRVNIKATTNEHLGYVGRNEGVHAFVVCELQKL